MTRTHLAERQSPMPEERTDVLITGAGPVGLSAALFLARQGIRPIVVEKRSTISQIPRATGVHSRTQSSFWVARSSTE